MSEKRSVRSVVNVDMVSTVNQAGYIYLFLRINFQITASGKTRHVTVRDGDGTIYDLDVNRALPT